MRAREVLQDGAVIFYFLRVFLILIFPAAENMVHSSSADDFGKVRYTASPSDQACPAKLICQRSASQGDGWPLRSLLLLQYYSLSSRKSGAIVVTFSLHHLTREDDDVGDVNRRILEIFIDCAYPASLEGEEEVSAG